MNGRFVICDICGSPGHKARSCGANKLEARLDPFGEDARRRAYRQRVHARRLLPPGSALANVQTSPRFGS